MVTLYCIVNHKSSIEINRFSKEVTHLTLIPLKLKEIHTYTLCIIGPEQTYKNTLIDKLFDLCYYVNHRMMFFDQISSFSSNEKPPNEECIPHIEL